MPFDAPEIPKPYRWENRAAPQSRKTKEPEYRGEHSRKTGRKSPVAFLAVLAMLFVLPSVLGILASITESVVSDVAYVRAEPETLPIPEDGLLLYDDGEVRVMLGWDGGAITGDIPVFLENNSQMDIVACTNGVAINGIMTDSVFFYLDARKGTTSMSQLWIDPALLEQQGIGEIAQIELLPEVMEEDSYIVRSIPETITFGPGGSITSPDILGQPLLKNDTVLLVFQGMETDAYGNIQLRLYVENRTGKMLELTSTELMINDQESGQYLWQNFFPDTSAVILVELYQTAALGIQGPGDIQTLSFHLEGTVDNDWSQGFITTPIVVHPGSNP